jgi:hypothetical protein
MASSAGLPPADARHAGAAAPADCGDELRSALAAAEASLLAALSLATPSAAAALPADARALLRRVGALSADLGALHDTLTAQQAGSSGVSRQRQRVEFSSLPHTLVVRVLAALPADARLRCAEVCKAWRAAVSDRSLWLRVDLLPASGVTRAVSAALLRAVAARAAGHLQALRLPLRRRALPVSVLLVVLRANSASMRELEVISQNVDTLDYFLHESVLRVLRAAPLLQVFRSNVTAPLRQVARLLRNEAPYGPLRVCFLHVVPNEPHTEGAEEEEEEEEERVDGADVLSLAGAMRQHASLQGVWLQDVPLDTPAVAGAFVDAALERRITQLDTEHCSLSPASAPALARLLGSTALTGLTIHNEARQLLDAAAAELLGDAFRANTTLRTLFLNGVDLWRDAAAGAAVVTALSSHPSLHELVLHDNRMHVAAAAATVGAALETLIAANAPALYTLDVDKCSLGDAGLAPMFHALPRNTHLGDLCCQDNGMSVAFARDTFLPAIRANRSLRNLVASAWWGGEEDGIAPAAVFQAEVLVTARANADALPV